MRRLLGSFLITALAACSSGSTTGTDTCPSYASAGGNRFAAPSYEWDQLNCACTSSQTDGGAAAGGSCSAGPQTCAKVCCSCPGSSGWTFSARACQNNVCLDQTAACQAVLAATGQPCKAATPQG